MREKKGKKESKTETKRATIERMYSLKKQSDQVLAASQVKLCKGRMREKKKTISAKRLSNYSRANINLEARKVSPVGGGSYLLSFACCDSQHRK